MEEKKPRIQYVNLSSNFIAYQEPLTYGTDKKWHRFGADDGFDVYLYNLRKQSSLHSGILDKKIKLDTGSGFEWDEKNIKLNKFYSELDSQLLEKSFSDFETIGGIYYGIKWYKKQIVDVEFIPFNNCRLGETIDDEFTTVYVSKNFKKARDARFIPVAVPYFTGEYKGNDYEIANVFRYTQNQVYPTQVYSPAINYIEADYEISKFHLSNILNSFNGGMFIVFTEGEPSPAQQKRLEDMIVNNSGTVPAGKNVLYYAENKDNVPIITPIATSQLHKQYEVLNYTIDNKILISHQMPRILANLETPGSLGDSKQLYQASETFYNEYVKAQQKYVIDFFNQINRINGIKEDVTIGKEQVRNNSLLIEMVDSIKDVLTKEELRELFGYSNEQSQTNIIQ